MDYTYNSNDTKFAADYDALSEAEKQYWTVKKYFAMREFVAKYCTEPLSNLMLSIQIDKASQTVEHFKPIGYALSEAINIDSNNPNDEIIKNIFDELLIDVYEIDERVAMINDLVEDINNDKAKG